jgi:predicted amidohydrolase YtcJ
VILVNGVIHTVDADQPRVSAVAIRDGRFVATGSDEEIRALAGPNTVIEDLGGAAVVPGLIDAHNHMQSTGIMLREVQLYDTRTIGEIVDRIAERVKSAAPGEWILGRGWDESGRDPPRLEQAGL